MIHEILFSSIKADNSFIQNRFIQSFIELYKIDIFKSSLDMTITSAKEGRLSFVVEEIKGWDRVHGHCKIEESVISNKYLINIKKITPSIIAHEIAHMLEKESKMNMETFRDSLKSDIFAQSSSNPNLLKAIQVIMKEELGIVSEDKAKVAMKYNNAIYTYTKEQIMSELFARYFEIMAMGKEIGGYDEYHFSLNDTLGFFSNVNKWMLGEFNILFEKKINGDVEKASQNVISTFSGDEEFSNKIKSFHDNSKKKNNIGGKSWSSVTKSINDFSE